MIADRLNSAAFVYCRLQEELSRSNRINQPHAYRAACTAFTRATLCRQSPETSDGVQRDLSKNYRDLSVKQNHAN